MLFKEIYEKNHERLLKHIRTYSLLPHENFPSRGSIIHAFYIRLLYHISTSLVYFSTHDRWGDTSIGQLGKEKSCSSQENILLPSVQVDDKIAYASGVDRLQIRSINCYELLVFVMPLSKRLQIFFRPPYYCSDVDLCRYRVRYVWNIRTWGSSPARSPIHLPSRKPDDRQHGKR